MLLKYGIVILTEIKTPKKICTSGFSVYQNSAKAGHRGGIALLVKPCFTKFIKNIDKTYENVIYYELEFLPNVVFIACYIAPSDSNYYDAAVFGYIQGIIKKDVSKTYVVVGDLNSRVGIPTELLDNGSNLHYTGCEDTIVNSNGKNILQVCKDEKLVVVNNLKYNENHYKSNLSFRKKQRWISEPDLLIISKKGLRLMEAFKMVRYFEGKHLFSDHGLIDFQIDVTKAKISTKLLKGRAENLGRSTYEFKSIKVEKSLQMVTCNKDEIKSYFAHNVPPVISVLENIDLVIDNFTRTVFNVMKANKVNKPVVVNEWGNQERWKRLLNCNDPRKIWKSIDWNGNIISEDETMPSDSEFKLHFEKLLDPDKRTESELIDLNDVPYVQSLDDPISIEEVSTAIKSTNENKSYIGVTPAIFECLPVIWMSFITQILNLIFLNNNLFYPTKWCYSKLIVLFKKGLRLLCDNYRGIAIGDTFGNIYAKILCNRLKKWIWLKIEKCQAGGQEKRDCIEHILGLRLLVDFAKKEKKKLFILFVDFSKAYDRVPRNTMFMILKKLGSGKVMLRAIVSIYKKTINILNSEYVRSTIGVKQGGPMSCVLFVIYLNVLAVMLKCIGNDSYLGDLHALMLMDDTVLLGTTREKIIEKFEILAKFCSEYGMVVNQKKTKLMVINGEENDREEFIVGDVIVKHALSYIYLGSPFTEDGRMDSVLDLHIESRISDLNKFKIFCAVNRTMPYVFKKKVLEDAIITSLFYGCESWLSYKKSKIEKMYMDAIKAALNVRQTTRNDTVLLESGMSTVKDMITEMTKRYMKKKLVEERDDETPLCKIYQMCEQNNTIGYNFIIKCLNTEHMEDLNKLKENFISNQYGSKALAYKDLNPNLTLHRIYSEKEYITEFKRVNFTRFRLSSHNLKIETGRWSRIPREDRLCECGEIQDELHVTLHCPQTNAIREKFELYNIHSLNVLMEHPLIVDIIHEVINVFN